MARDFRYFRGVRASPTPLRHGTFRGVSLRLGYPARRLRQAGLLAGLAALLAVACGADTISLLPPMPGGSAGAGAVAGNATAGQMPSAGSDNASGGSSSGAGGNAGSVNGGSNAQGGSICSGLGCGGVVSIGGNIAGPPCFNGFDNCTPCSPQGQCPNGQQCDPGRDRCVWCLGDRDCGDKEPHCDRATGRCAPGCDVEQRCVDGRVCDTAWDVCVQCVTRDDCASRFPDVFCHQHRCVECEVSDDCEGPGQRYCLGYRCIECLSDHDCPNNEFCNNDGRCQ